MMNKRTYIGASILALSKTYMYNFHYNYIMKKFPDCKVLFTDTDSFCYILSVDDFDNALKKDKEIFDFSNYPEDHDNFSVENKMVPGKLKDEGPNRAKMYSILLENDLSMSAVKGVCKVVAKQQLTHEMFKLC